MIRKGLLLYAAFLSLGTSIAVALLSAWLALKGYTLSWIQPLAGGTGFALRNAWILVPGFGLGALVTAAVHLLATRTGNRAFYFAGWVLVVVVVAVTALVLYGGACGFCRRAVCQVGGVKSCGIQVRLSISFVQIYCQCYQPSGALWPGGLHLWNNLPVPLTTFTPHFRIV